MQKIHLSQHSKIIVIHVACVTHARTLYLTSHHHEKLGSSVRQKYLDQQA